MKTKLFSTSILLSLFAFASPLTAQWFPLNGPTVAQGTCRAFDGSSVYVQTGARGLYHSSDRGNTWGPLNPIPSGEISSVAASGDTLLVGTTGGQMFYSTDCGATWTALRQEFISNTGNWYVFHDITVVAIYHSKFYVGAWGLGWFLSTDRGQTWSLQCNALYKEPLGYFSQGDYLYGVAAVSLLQFGDNGSCRDITTMGVWNIRGTGANDSVIFVGGYGMARSSDGGNSWGLIEPQWKNHDIGTMAVEGSSIYVWTGVDGLTASTDGGTTWIQKHTDLPVHRISELYLHSGYLFANIDGYGAMRSTDGGETWKELGVPRAPLAFAQLFTIGLRVFGSTYQSGMWMSADSGASWQRVLSDPNLGYFSQMFSIGPDIFGISEFTGTYRSQDGGLTWQFWNPEVGALNPGDRDIGGSVVLGATVFVSSRQNGVLRSTNNAWAWTNVSNGITDRSVVSLTAAGTTLFAGTARSGVFRSTDNGDHWTESINGIPIRNIRSLAGNEKVVYAASEWGAIYYSTDAGDSWRSSQQPDNGLMFHTFIASGDFLFANSSGRLMFCSNTLGRYVSTPYPDRTISSMALLGKSLIVSTPDSGLYRYILPLPPTAKNILPAQASVLQTFSVTLDGTNFVPDLTSLSFGKGIDVYSLVVESATRLRATVTITGSAPIGTHDAIVNVVPGGGSDTLRNALTIDYPAPRISYSDRSSVKQGETVYIHLSGSNFLNGLTTVEFGEGINVVTSRPDGSGQISATLFVTPGAKVGPRDITVTNPQPGGGTSVLRSAFRVIESSGMEVAPAPRPTEFRLYNAYPNPFNPATRIEFDLPEPGEVRIDICNSIGMLIETISGHNDYALRYAVNWHADRNPSGVYLVRLRATSKSSGRSFEATQKVILLR